MTESSVFSPDELFMGQAFQQAQIAFDNDEVPVGAVIVYQNKIIAKAYNQVETLKDSTAHAEMIAITQACNNLKTKWLSQCVMYVTLEPCAMCTGALVLSRIKKVIFGADDPKTGACGSVFNIAQCDDLNHSIELEQGPLRNECSAILKEFFQKKRHLSN